MDTTNFNAYFSNFSKCDYCQKPFSTARGLQSHQSRDTPKNYGCHRLQKLHERVATQREYKERKENIRQVKLQDHDVIVSLGPHRKGSPITAKEKRCILNLYQSFRDDDRMSPKEARNQTAKRLKFGIASVRLIIKEMLLERNVEDNKQNVRTSPNAHEKLSDEEEDELRQLIHNEMRKCNVSRMTEENKDVTYPTIASVHKAVMETELFPSWSISTFRTILLGMNIKFQAKSEVDRAVLIEDDHPLHR